MGRPYLIAMHVRDLQGQVNLRQLRKGTYIPVDPDSSLRTAASGSTVEEYEPWDFARVYPAKRGMPFRMVTGWGEDVSKKLKAIEKASNENMPQELYLCWSYPPIESGYDAWDFPRRRIAEGVELLGPGEVLPWVGSRFKDGTVLQGSSGPLPQVPQWLAAKLGKPRSRRVMNAAREAYEMGLNST